MKTWEKINSDLGGQNGIVYLMYVGRNTTGETIWQEIEQSKISEKIKENGKLVEKIIMPSLLANQEQIYAAQTFLLKNKYIYDVRKEGHYRVRTANYEALLESQQQLEGKITRSLAKIVAKYIDIFPAYTNCYLSNHHSSIRGKEWSYIYEFIYENFVSDLIFMAVFLPLLRKNFPEMNTEKILDYNTRKLKRHQQLSSMGIKQIKALVKIMEKRSKNISLEDSRAFKEAVLGDISKELTEKGFPKNDVSELNRILADL